MMTQRLLPDRRAARLFVSCGLTPTTPAINRLRWLITDPQPRSLRVLLALLSMLPVWSLTRLAALRVFHPMRGLLSAVALADEQFPQGLELGDEL
jgi:hypothetical protein